MRAAVQVPIKLTETWFQEGNFSKPFLALFNLAVISASKVSQYSTARQKNNVWIEKSRCLPCPVSCEKRSSVLFVCWLPNFVCMYLVDILFH